MSLFEMISDIAGIKGVLFIVKSGDKAVAATAEIQGNRLGVRMKGKWITVGGNDDLAHMHVNSEEISSAEFVEETRPTRTSYSVRFFDKHGNRVLAAFFTGIYDMSSNILIQSRKAVYDDLCKKYPKVVNF